MTTILPEKNKKEMKREYLFRFSKVFVQVLILACFVFLIFQIAIYFYIKIEKEGFLKIASDSDQQQRNLAIVEYKEELSKAKNLLEKFDSNSQNTSSIIDFVYGLKKETIEINSMSIDIMESGNFVTLSGFATNREDLLVFSQSLEQSKNISDFKLPFSSLSKSTEIPFSLTFKYSQHEQK